MFLEIEGEVLINVELIDRVEMLHRRKTATVWIGGVGLGESDILYDFLMLKENEGLFAKQPIART